MKQKQVIITVQPDGSTVVDADGFQGKGCAEATQAIELALAGSDPSNRDDKRKPDFYATNPGTNVARR